MEKKREFVFDDELTAKEQQQFTQTLNFQGWGQAVAWHGKQWRVIERVRSQEGKRGFRVQRIT